MSRAEALHTDYDFSGGAGMPDADRDKPTRERLDALHGALEHLHGISHEHDYDPDAIDDFDASELSAEGSERRETATTAKQVKSEFDAWDEENYHKIADARAAAKEESARFRADLTARAHAARQAAMAVIALPTNAVDEDTRAAAHEVAQKALRLVARTRRTVKLSLTLWR